MADWNSSNITLTAQGSSALSRVEAGDGSLTITRVVASEQYVQESTLREVTTLSVENLELTIIDRHEVEDGGSVIQAQLSNLNLTEKFTLNEIGVFATHSSDPTNEFLYIIAQVDLGTGDEIPLYSTTPITATYDIYLYNVGADKVNVTISSAGLVTYEALNNIYHLVRRSTAYELGQTANYALLPTGMYLECIVAGTTASIPISLPASPQEGDTVTDGSVTWVLNKVASHRKLGYRQPSTAYTAGQIAYHSALPTGYYLECTTAGTTSAGDITPTSTIGGTVSDGTVVWTVKRLQNMLYQSFIGESNITDLDNVTKTGLYEYDSALNKPSNELGNLLVTGCQDDYAGNWITQLALCSNRTAFTRSKRSDTGNAWLPWIQSEQVIAKSLDRSGYIKYASGLILQWGYIMSVQAGNNTTVNFPISFTVDNPKVFLQDNNTANTTPRGLHTFDCYRILFKIASSVNLYMVNWFAIGY